MLHQDVCLAEMPIHVHSVNGGLLLPKYQIKHMLVEHRCHKLGLGNIMVQNVVVTTTDLVHKSSKTACAMTCQHLA